MSRQFEEGIGNEFDAPIPGQSLTDTPGNYPWEHPAQFADPEEASEYIWDRLHADDFAEQVVAMLDAKIPVEAIARVILFGGFLEGKFSPDVAFLITKPVMQMITVIGATAGVGNIRVSMTDITNDQQLLDIVKTKIENENFEKEVKGVQKDIKKLSGGLMSKPEKEEDK
jgi:hypothetical protein|tara:strand:- start:1866 stop:2375 length:510 start_codon:yes stop_codon:yes gene_type:complete